MFRPNYRITPWITTALMAIEADRQAVAELPIDVAMLASLRETARLAATHYSTQIEGNRLTEIQVKEVVAGATFPGRERDELEVRHYYRALEETQKRSGELGVLSEEDIRRINGLMMTGQAKPTPYRDGQNVIRNSQTRSIVYMPPEAKDVPRMMAELVEWINRQRDERELPVPLVAAMAHYQFATIHPYYDGNGRTARLLTTLLLHAGGYGLKGIYSLEAYYARNLAGYYDALTVGGSHNYYMGRAEADITGFLTYFCQGMADAFSAVRAQAIKAAQRGAKDVTTQLRKLNPRERRLLELFRKQQTATATEMAVCLGLSPRTVVGFCRKWLASGFLEMSDPSRKNRAYQLGRKYEGMIK